PPTSHCLAIYRVRPRSVKKNRRRSRGRGSSSLVPLMRRSIRAATSGSSAPRARILSWLRLSFGPHRLECRTGVTGSEPRLYPRRGLGQFGRWHGVAKYLRGVDIGHGEAPSNDITALGQLAV